MDAAGHAVEAARLLEHLDRFEREVSDAMADPDRRLQLQAGGHLPSINADIRHGVQVAAAHALASIALSLVELTAAPRE